MRFLMQRNKIQMELTISEKAHFTFYFHGNPWKNEMRNNILGIE